MTDTSVADELGGSTPIGGPSTPVSPVERLDRLRPPAPAMTPIPEVTESDHAAAAREARETAQRVARRRARVPEPTETKKVEPGQNRFDQFDDDPMDDGVGMAERLRLNALDSYYRGDPIGASGLAAMAEIYRTPDGPDVDPDRKAANDRVREQYLTIVGDLMAYDQMPDFETPLEASVALAGQLGGAIVSPVSWIGWGAKGASWLTRAARAGVQQGAIQAAVDPAVQGLNIQAGVQDRFDPVRMALSAGLGFTLGAGGQMVGDVAGHWLGQRMARRLERDLAAADNDFMSARVAEEMALPERSVDRPDTVGAPEKAPLGEAPGDRLPEPPDTVGAPDYSFQDAVARAKKAAQDADREARKAARDAGELELGDVKKPDERDFEARQKVLEEEVGAETRILRDEFGLDDNDLTDILQRYDRTAGETPQGAFRRAVDDWADEAERDAIKVIDGTDSEFWRDLKTFNDAYDADVARGWPAAEYQADFRKGNTIMLPERGSFDLEPRGVGDIPFEPKSEAQSGGGRAAEQADRQVSGQEGRPGEGRAAATDGGEPRGAAGDGQLGRSTAAERARDERLVADLPPVPNGMVRFYHGGADAISGGSRDVTPDFQYARTFRAEGTPKEVWYVDVPADSAWIREIDVSGTNMPRTLQNSVAPADVMAKAKVVPGTELRTERTTQGDQTLIPGVEPITDKQRAQAGMAKPMQGGDRPPPAGGLFDADARAQGDLLDTPAQAKGGEPLSAAEREELNFLRAMGAHKGNASAKDAARYAELAARDRAPVSALMGTDGDRPAIQAIEERRSGAGLLGERERDAAGTPGRLSPAQQEALESTQQLSIRLAEALGIPVRQGRVEMRRALGTYNRRTGVARVQEIPDFEVVSHELGHGLEGLMGQPLTDLTNNHAWELIRLDYDQDPTTGQRVFEGFAVWIRYYIGDPNYARNLAPTFTPEFINFMNQNRPDLMRAIDDVSRAFNAYLEAPSVDAVGSVIRSRRDEPNGWAARTVATLRDEGFGPTIRMVMQRAYDAIFDDKQPMARAVRELARVIMGDTGRLVELQAADNPEVLLRLQARAQQAAILDMIEGVRLHRSTTPFSVSLQDAMREALGQPSAFGNWDPARAHDFSTYLVAKRAEYLWRRRQAGNLDNPPASFSQADALMAMDELEAQYPAFRRAGDLVHQYSKALMEKAYSGGLITRDLLDRLREDEFYVPFRRDMRDRPMASTGGAGGTRPEGPGTAEVVRRIRGSSRDILDPIESLMMQTFMVNRTLAHNNTMLALVRLGERAGRAGGAFVEPIPAHQLRQHTVNLEEILRNKGREIGMPADDIEAFIATLGTMAGEDPLIGSFWRRERANPNGEPILFYRDGGELRAARFMSSREEGGHALYELLSAAPEPIADLFNNIITLGANVMRAGITTNPTFILSNYIRDQMAAGILRSDYVPFFSGLRGMWEEATQGESARLYTYAGGSSGGAAVGAVERAAEADINALNKQGFIINRASSLKGFMELASFTEAGTRNSIFHMVYRRRMAQGLSSYEAMIEAAMEAQDFLDFTRHGSRMLWLRQNIPFLNATMQGLDKAFRTGIEPLYRGQVLEQDAAALRNAGAMWTKIGIMGALGAAWAAVNWDREMYRNATSENKAVNFILPWGDRYFVIPKPFELGLGFTAGEYAYARLVQEDPRAAEQFAEAVWEVMAPPDPLKHMPIVTPITELRLGRSLFTGKDIVPKTLQGLPPEMQYTDRTTAIAKEIGQLLGVSPIKVEYAIGANFGTWGRDIAAMSQGIDEDAPAAQWADTAFVRRFLKDPTRFNATSKKFWEYMARDSGKFNQALKSYDEMVKQFRDDRAKEVLSRLPENQKAYVTLNSAGREDGKPAFDADEKRLFPLRRAYDAVTLINGLRTPLSTNTYSEWQTREPKPMSPELRRDLIDELRKLGQMEMYNAFVIMKEPGYAKQPLQDVNEVFEKIQALSPDVARELATRYATAKIYSTEAVREAWPTLKSELLRFGSGADIAFLKGDARAAGYEFSGDRTRKPQKRRIPVAPSPAPTR